MRRLFAPLVVALVAGVSPAFAGDPIVMDSPGQGPRFVVVIQDKKAYLVHTIAWPEGIPFPVPGPGPTPGPQPDPTPTPQPPPVPPAPPVVVTGHLTAIYVAAADPTVDQAAMTKNSVILAALPALDTTWRWFEADEPGIQVKGVETGESILSLAQKAGLPAVVFQKQGGQVVDTIPATTPEAIVSHLKSLRGVK